MSKSMLLTASITKHGTIASSSSQSSCLVIVVLQSQIHSYVKSNFSGFVSDYTVKPLITDPPKNEQPLYSGRLTDYHAYTGRNQMPVTVASPNKK